MLGQPASHGCVRLCVRDAKWIYDNCGLYTTVVVSDTEYTPFDKVPTIKIPAGQNWDPTDTDARRYFRKSYRVFNFLRFAEYLFFRLEKP